MKLKRGDKVKHIQDSYVGSVTNIKERGVAGSSVTWIEWVEVSCENGIVVKADPSFFKLVEDE